jgi:hypothetical protein
MGPPLRPTANASDFHTTMLLFLAQERQGLFPLVPVNELPVRHIAKVYQRMQQLTGGYAALEAQSMQEEQPVMSLVQRTSPIRRRQQPDDIATLDRIAALQDIERLARHLGVRVHFEDQNGYVSEYDYRRPSHTNTGDSLLVRASQNRLYISVLRNGASMPVDMGSIPYSSETELYSHIHRYLRQLSRTNQRPSFRSQRSRREPRFAISEETLVPSGSSESVVPLSTDHCDEDQVVPNALIPMNQSVFPTLLERIRQIEHRVNPAASTSYLSWLARIQRLQRRLEASQGAFNTHRYQSRSQLNWSEDPNEHE